MDIRFSKVRSGAFRKRRTPPRKPARLEGRFQNRGIRKLRRSKKS